MSRLILIAFALFFVSTLSFAEDGPQLSKEDAAFFEQKVKPLLTARCGSCHGTEAKEPKGGLRLTSRNAALKGGESGPSIVPGKPGDSILIQAVNYDGFEMPPRSRLPQGEVAILTKWVKLGAPWPKTQGEGDAMEVEATAFPLKERKAAHWSWQPLTEPRIPEVKNVDWPATDIDRFVLAKLEQSGLKPVDDADRAALIRRVYFDLIGLPPEPAAVDSFVQDPASTDQALANVVDQLLSSEQFGERWARHWLDLVRYAETLGHEFDYPLRHAFEYRDYVIRAFNQDVPYDVFVTEHIAGDLMPEPRKHPTEGFNEALIGTGFWFMGEDKHAPVDVKGEEASKVDNQIDVFSRTFLGLTVACARCHDHKFDAISTKDYYALAGFLQSSRRQIGQLDPHEKIASVSEQIQEAREKFIQNIAGPPATARADELDRLTKAVGERANAIEHPLHAWSILSKVDADRFVTERDRLAKAVNDRLKKYDERNKQSVLFEDFNSGYDDWFATGKSFGLAPAIGFDMSVENRLVPPGVAHSGRGPNRLQGVLRSKTFEITQKQILYRVAGENARIRIIIDGYVMDDFNGLLFNGAKFDVKHGNEFRWHRQAADVSRYVGHRAHIELLDEGDGWIAVDEIRFSDGGPDPGTPLSATTKSLFENVDFTDRASLAKAYSKRLTDRTIKAELLNLTLGVPDSPSAKKLIETRKAMQKIAQSLPRPRPVIAITDGSAENEHVFIRGNHKNLGEFAPRGLLTAIAGDSQPAPSRGSGRLQLAQQLLHESNPYPARVMANRLWHHLLGRGIVASTDNFGVLGQRPTHPQLLDHLATRLIKNGWSIKKTIREIVLSRTWRLASHSNKRMEKRDPNNLLLHRANLKRLQSESIRDSMLALSGTLDRKLYGPSVPVHLTAFMQGRGRPRKNGPLDGNGRRSIYTAVNRNFLSPMMLAFDTPIPFTAIGRRSVSNVPAQALILMNDPFVIDQAAKFAKRILSEAVSTQGRIQLLYKTAFARPATDQETQQAILFLDGQAAEHSVKDWTNNEQVWGDFCHVLFNVKEFIYLR